MKRTNLVLDEELLQTATRMLGAKTYSATVNQALKETIRTLKARGLSEFIGADVWTGDLSEMRNDNQQSSKRSKRKS